MGGWVGWVGGRVGWVGGWVGTCCFFCNLDCGLRPPCKQTNDILLPVIFLELAMQFSALANQPFVVAAAAAAAAAVAA